MSDMRRHHPHLRLWADHGIDDGKATADAQAALKEIDALRATVARLETELAALQRDTQPYIAAAVTAVNRCDLETKEN